MENTITEEQIENIKKQIIEEFKPVIEICQKIKDILIEKWLELRKLIEKNKIDKYIKIYKRTKNRRIQKNRLQKYYKNIKNKIIFDKKRHKIYRKSYIIFIKGEDIMKFKVKGTSYNNENGENRQEIIQKVVNTYIENEQIDKEELYDGNTNKDIKEYGLEAWIYEGIHFPAKLKKSKFNNENCIEVYLINYYKSKKKVGYIPKDLVDTMWKDVNEDEEIPVKILGGKRKEYDILEDKVIVDDTRNIWN